MPGRMKWSLHEVLIKSNMVDAFDLFRRLSFGAKFDKKRVENSFKRLEGEDENVLDGKQNVADAVDFFGYRNLNENASEQVAVEQEITQYKTKKKVKDGGHGEDGNKKRVKKRKRAVEENDHSELVSKGKSRKKKEKHSIEKLSELQREKVNAFRNKHHIYVNGSDIPDPIECFTDLDSQYALPHYLLNNVLESGYAQPTPIQMQAIPLLLQNRELLACAPTGSGKTAAFILPILYHLKEPRKCGFRCVVVSPTRELAQQIYREFCRLSKGKALRIHILTKAKANANNFGPKSSKRFDILVTTPNRLVHMLQQDPPAVNLEGVEWLIFDEADKLFEEGKDGFRDQIATIYQACSNPKIRRGLFSATLSNGIEEWTRVHLDNAVRITIGVRNSATDTVEQELLFVGQESGKLIAIRDIIQKGFEPPMLVFVQSKDRAKELFHELIYDGINVDVIHSDRTQSQRDNIVKCFRTGKIWVLICTELMGRGIDFKGVNLVINYDFPTSSVAYIHRIGRTGRAGRTGKAVTFFTEDDVVNLRSIANVIKSSGGEVPDWMLQIKKAPRKSKQKLSKVPVKRSSIKTVTKYDLNKAKKRREMIKSSKRKGKTKTEDDSYQE
ncbi:probable ATP-dependent RNA helicase DDX52 [Dendronephthya gigantea]|uniref:probable ATP-dependent RNA helicase DDX52 n=1 Tax=Dendronephthya gigantea TaxID=151771 RepID=UPI00106A8C91|nr:probable ATP-dependent RNA helicase DDX52 [Dendronephthya gigantea]